jgi:hypothetical protein
MSRIFVRRTKCPFDIYPTVDIDAFVRFFIDALGLRIACQI